MSRVEELRQLLDEATPGPWHLFTNRHPTSDGQPWGCVETRRHPAGGAGTPLLKGCYWTGVKQRSDAALIAAAPQALADLLDVAEQVQRLVASETDAEEGLCTLCDDRIEEDGRCSCWLSDLRAALTRLGTTP